MFQVNHPEVIGYHKVLLVKVPFPFKMRLTIQAQKVFPSMEATEMSVI
jgi:hypothetical protein